MRFICIFLVLFATLATAAEIIPPAPKEHFNDYAHVVSPATATDLNRQLEQFERDTSSQILVTVYPKMQSDSSIEDYTVRVAQSWGVGQKNRNNGAVLFVFVQDRKLYIQVGYGLEGALPDALAKRIIENEIKPHLRNGDFDGGLRAGVTAILQATKGEYKGTSHIAADQSLTNQSPMPSWTFGLFLAFAILILLGRLLSHAAGGTVYSRAGRAISYGIMSGMFSGGGGGFSSGGGGFSSGGGGFSGGGGGFGGGGAGGSW
jgi:uncharacterized protein